ncbi:MAG: DUF2934 domain-containing protein [Candidatus Omnitrophica bacterium]|jgi:hypothetical protein|nr:DUF2934 domain-containing protein [Candidatus Omnitrophota bacterium]
MAFPGRKPFTEKSASKIDEVKLNQMIRERAYYIWESKGKPKGQDQKIWLQAEKEVLSRVRR